MVDEEHKQKQVVAIVAAYNEEERIGEVLQVLTSYPFSEIIVVDDGSTDNTAAIASSYSIRLIRHEKNMGKGRAMDNAVTASSTGVLFFCDADVKGLTHQIIRETIDPVLTGETDMMIAMRNRKIYYASFVLAILPVVARQLWEQVPSRYKHRFMIEAALNFYARYWGQGFRYKVFRGLTQTVKEKKYGFRRGFKARIKMLAEIFEVQIRLQLTAVPATIHSGRLAFTSVAGAVTGAAFGVALLAASYTGPVQFIREVWAEELAGGDAPFVHLLLSVAGNIGADLLVAAGIFIIGFNLLVIILSFKNVRYLFNQPSPAERVE